jgi:hypothetical protein
MDGRLFLGVADNNQSAVAVVGDSGGRIVATSVGRSINHQRHGISQARENLRDLLARTVGSQGWESLERVCFTYKSDLITSDHEMAGVVHGVLDVTEILVENFARSCTLGMRTDRDRMLLVGGQASLVVFENMEGLRFQMREDPMVWDFQRRLQEKLNIGCGFSGHEELSELLELDGVQLGELVVSVDNLARKGNLLALELVHEVAHDLVYLVIKMARHFQSFDPVIGLYGRVLFGSQLVYERVCHLLGLLFPHARVQEATMAPAKGAYLSTLEERKSPAEPEVMFDSPLLWGNLEQRGWQSGANGYQVAERNDQQVF